MQSNTHKRHITSLHTDTYIQDKLQQGVVTGEGEELTLLVEQRVCSIWGHTCENCT